MVTIKGNMVTARVIVGGQDLAKKIDLIMEHLILKGAMSRGEKSKIVIDSKVILNNPEDVV